MANSSDLGSVDNDRLVKKYGRSRPVDDPDMLQHFHRRVLAIQIFRPRRIGSGSLRKPERDKDGDRKYRENKFVHGR